MFTLCRHSMEQYIQHDEGNMSGTTTGMNSFVEYSLFECILLTSFMVCQILLRLTSGIASGYQRDVNIKDSDFHRWHHLIDTDDYSFQKQLFPETFTSRIHEVCIL